MRAARVLLVLAVFSFATACVKAQIAPEKALATFSVSDPDLQLSLFASEPLFCNPTSIDVDHLGRVWVCEAVNYRQILHGKPVLRPEGDRILILEDTKGQGRADKVTVFAQAPYIQAPLGIAVLKEPVGPGWKVFICQSPDILVFEDKDGDGRADGPPKKLLTGFGGLDHDHGVHGLMFGPDGKFYFSVGDQGVKDLQSSDGRGRKWTTNKTDCQAGTIWRCNVDGTGLELLAHNFRNQYEPCVDRNGNIFVSDNDDDGNEQTRICYVMPGGNYGYWPRGPGESHWHEEQPGIVHKILRTGFGSPTGMCVYEGTLLPEKYRGRVLHTDAGPRQLRAYTMKPQGAGFECHREDLVTSTDNWFRPSDVCVAPDGSVFIADWYDPGVGGHGMGDTTRGRIYRLAPKGHAYGHGEVKLNDRAGTDAAIQSPANSVRIMGHQARRAFSSSPAVFPVKSSALSDAAKWRDELLKMRAADPMTIRSRLLELMKKCDGKDHFYLAAIGIAVGNDPDRRNILLSEFDKQFPNWDFRTAGLVWELQPKVMLPKLSAWMIDDSIPTSDRARVVDILARAGDVEIGRQLLTRLVSERNPIVRERLQSNLESGLRRQWKALAASTALTSAIEQCFTQTPTVQSGIGLIAASGHVQSISQLNGVISAVKMEAPTVQAAIRALGELPSADAVAALQGVLTTSDDPSRVQTAAQSLARHIERMQEPTHSLALALLKQSASNADHPLVAPAAIAALSRSRAGTVWLLDQAGSKQMRPEQFVDVARILRNSPFPDLRNRALVQFPPPGKLDLKKLPEPRVLALRHGDAKHGEELMRESSASELQCLKCHAIRGAGGSIGPDLSLIGVKASRENLFESLINPSKAVADQFAQWQIVTDKGLSLTGLLMREDNRELHLRDANGVDHKIDVKEIDSKQKMTTSLMPDNLLGGISEDELADVVEYLTTLRTPALTPSRWQCVGPTPAEPVAMALERAFSIDQISDLRSSQGVRQVAPNQLGQVDLRAAHGAAADRSVSWLETRIFSSVEQSGRILLGTDDGARLWVNGALVYTENARRPAKPWQDSIPVTLQQGENRLRLKIVNDSGPHGFYLTVLAESALTSAEGR